MYLEYIMSLQTMKEVACRFTPKWEKAIFSVVCKGISVSFTEFSKTLTWMT